jgi:hypothetical protein
MAFVSFVSRPLPSNESIWHNMTAFMLKVTDISLKKHSTLRLLTELEAIEKYAKFVVNLYY